MNFFITRFLTFFLLIFSLLQMASAQDSADTTKQKRKLNTSVAVWTGDFDVMLKKRRIRMLIPYSRTLYFIDKGRERGLSAELTRDFERYLNTKYKKQLNKRPITILIIPTSRDRLFENIINGKGDIASGNLTITPERLKLVDFAIPGGTKNHVSEIIVTRKGSEPRIRSVDDLSGQTIYVRKSSSYYNSLEDLNQKFQAKGKPIIDIELVPDELEDEDLMEMVNAGLISTIVVDDIKVKIWSQLLTQLDAHYDVVLRKDAQLGWAIRKNSPKLATEITEFQKKFVNKQNVIVYRWKQSIARMKQIKNNTSQDEYKRFESVITLFEKYGHKYSFDPLMLAAQGFQESQLKQSARSPSGAIGVMQVLPSTGKSLKVGDIRNIESNVHAGTKYMDLLMSKYFKGSKFNDENRALFALASYNAGPGNIAKMRRLAEAQGLNPNVWFDNVEVVTAAKIGIETTTYVRNIFKYYVSYRLVMDKKERAKKLKEQFKNQI